MTRERAKRKAQFCLAIGISPGDYEELTGFEIEAFIEIHNQSNT